MIEPQGASSFFAAKNAEKDGYWGGLFSKT
jgi:hypothetical protein